RLHVMALMLPDEFALLHAQETEVLDIDSVCARGGTSAVPLEIAVANRDGAHGVVVGKDAVFIADEAAVLDRDVSAFHADFCTVVVFHLGVFGRYHANDDNARVDDEQAFVCAAPVGDDRSFALDRQPAHPSWPHGTIDIGPGSDLHRVAGADRTRG